MSDPVMIPSNLNAATAQRFYAVEVLRLNGGARTKTAKALNVDTQTLRRWLASLVELGVEVPPARQGRPPVNPKPRGSVLIELPERLATSA